MTGQSAWLVDRQDHWQEQDGQPRRRVENELLAHQVKWDPAARLEGVLSTFATVSRQRHDTDLAALLHRGPHIAQAHEQLTVLIRDLIGEGALRGDLRDDVAPEDLAHYCLHALTAASALQSVAAVERLVAVTLDGRRPPPRR